MNDCEAIILEELKEVKRDIKNLLLDVNTLKIRSAMWGLIGGAIFTILTMVVPMMVKSISVNPTHAQTIQVDTSYVNICK